MKKTRMTGASSGRRRRSHEHALVSVLRMGRMGRMLLPHDLPYLRRMWDGARETHSLALRSKAVESIQTDLVRVGGAGLGGSSWVDLP